jgi:SulP family sulfate permease
MFGFVNGLAIIIFMSQLEQFKTVVNGESVWLSGSPMFIMLGLVALTIAIVFLPKVTKVPASLVAIIVVFDWF